MNDDVEVLGIQHVPIKYIRPNPDQPRKNFDQAKLQELADSIRDNGLLQNPVVRFISDTDFIIVAGERRWRAHKLLGVSSVECKVIKCSDRKAYELSIIENLKRVDVDLLEEAGGYEFFRKEYNLTITEISERVGKSSSWISNVLYLLSEPPEIQEYVKDGTLTSTILQGVRGLPNLHEKLVLLEKVRKEEIKKTDVRDYVRQVRDLYQISEQLGIDPEEVRKRGIHHKGAARRFDIKEELALPPDFRFFFICDHLVTGPELQYFPRTTILSSAFTYMHSKSAAKRLTSILMRRRLIELLFMDSGAVSAAKKGLFDFFKRQDQLIQFYESYKPDICVMMDYPTYGGTFTSQQVVDGTLANAEAFRDWTPSFDTTKVYALQGEHPEDYLRCFRGLLDLGVFRSGERQALAMGSIAKCNLADITNKISLVLQDQDFQDVRSRLEFFHGFGVGQPNKIVPLYDLGFNSFDALTTVIITAVGKWWVRGKMIHHLIQESPLARKVRLLFNVNSFWGQLCETFAEHKGIQLSDEKASIDQNLSFLDSDHDIQEDEETSNDVENALWNLEPELKLTQKKLTNKRTSHVDFESFSSL